MQKGKKNENVYLQKNYNDNNIIDLQDEDFNITFSNANISSTINKVSLSFLTSFNQNKSKILQKFYIKNKAKSKNEQNLNETINSINIDKDKNKYKDKDKPKKIYNLLKKEKYKSKNLNTSKNRNRNLFKSKTNREKIMFSKKNNSNLKKGKENLDNNNHISRNNLNGKTICEEYNNNGGENKTTEKKKKNIIISKINESKKINYFKNINSKTTYSLKKSNKEKNYKKLFNQNQKKNIKDVKDNNNFDLKFIKKKEKNQRKKNTMIFNHLSESPENGGISSYNKIYNISENSKNKELLSIENDSNTFQKKILFNRTYIENLMDKNLSKTNYIYEDSHMKTFDNEKIMEEKNIIPNISHKKQIIKTQTYKKYNLTLNKDNILSNNLQNIFNNFTTSSSSNKISYNEKLERKKKFLGICLNSKENIRIKKKMEDDLKMKNIKNYFCLYKLRKCEDENKTIKIIDKNNNSIKFIRKRSGYKDSFRTISNNKYENELGKTSEDKVKKKHTKKIKYIHKKIGYTVFPKGLDLMRRLTEF